MTNFIGHRKGSNYLCAHQPVHLFQVNTSRVFVPVLFTFMTNFAVFLDIPSVSICCWKLTILQVSYSLCWSKYGVSLVSFLGTEFSVGIGMDSLCTIFFYRGFLSRTLTILRTAWFVNELLTHLLNVSSEFILISNCVNRNLVR